MWVSLTPHINPMSMLEDILHIRKVKNKTGDTIGPDPNTSDDDANRLSVPFLPLSRGSTHLMGSIHI